MDWFCREHVAGKPACWDVIREMSFGFRLRFSLKNMWEWVNIYCSIFWVDEDP